jgi:DNA-binding transcriptional ArsR family regulator
MFAKTEAFEDTQREVARIAKLMSHPARVAILQHLAKTKTCISGDIALELPLSRTTVSQHLQELKNGGLIKGNVDGLNVCYCIDEAAFADAKALFDVFFITTDEQMKCC